MNRADIVFLGFTMPADEMQEIYRLDPAMPVQTQNFAWAIVHGLEESGARVQLLSAASVSNFPGLRRVVFRAHRFVSGGTPGQTLGFVNILGIKHLTRFVSCLVTGTRTLRRARPKVLLIHGIHSPFLWYGVLAGAVLRIRTVVILTDPPGVVLTSDSALARMLKSWDIPLTKAGIRRLDGVVVLAADLAREFAPGRPFMVMEGLVAATTPDREPAGPTPVQSEPGRARLIYAGGLAGDSGVDRLVTAVRGLATATSRAGNPPATLQIYGRGELSEWIDSVAAQVPAVRPPQFLPPEQVRGSYRSADLLIQPRPADHPTARHSFPSKLLEYMASGVPVLTTRLPGIPSEYEPYVYWIENDSVGGMQEALRVVLSIPASRRLEKGRRAAEFVRQSRNGAAQGARMQEFFASLDRTG